MASLQTGGCSGLGLSRLVAVIVIDHNELVKTVLYQ